MRAPSGLGAAMLIALCASARADVKQDISEFGLLGAWSNNCGAKPSEVEGRIEFTAPTDGPATAVGEDRRGEWTSTTTYQVSGVSRLAADKVRVALHPVKVVRSDGGASPRGAAADVALVFKKDGDRLVMVALQFKGTPQIERSIPFAKCNGR